MTNTILVSVNEREMTIDSAVYNGTYHTFDDHYSVRFVNLSQVQELAGEGICFTYEGTVYYEFPFHAAAWILLITESVNFTDVPPRNSVPTAKQIRDQEEECMMMGACGPDRHTEYYTDQIPDYIEFPSEYDLGDGDELPF